MLSEARSILSPSVFRSLTTNVATHYYGVDLAFQPGENDPDFLIAPFNRIAQGAKNVVLHSELTHLYQAAAERRGFQPRPHLYFAPGHGPEDKGVKFRREFYEISQQPDTREGYVANARRCGLFFSVAQYESFGIYYMELLFAGAVGVFLDRPWVRRLIPEYPFIVPEERDRPLHAAYPGELRRGPRPGRQGAAGPAGAVQPGGLHREPGQGPRRDDPTIANGDQRMSN